MCKDKDSRSLRRVAESAARVGADVAMAGFRSPDLMLSRKSDMHDLVTEYDSATEFAIREELLTHYPRSAVLGEEQGLSGRKDSKLIWHVDPIDGTSAYATGLALWCICIGAELDGQVVAGVVYDPVSGQLFRADSAGAFLGESKLFAAGRTEPSDATVVSHFPWPRDLVWDAEDSMQRFREITESFSSVRCIGSGALGLCYAAAGWVDAVLNLGANSWDVAAAAFILRQAGGTYTAYSNSEKVDEQADHYCGNYLGTVQNAKFSSLHELVRYQSGRDGAANVG